MKTAKKLPPNCVPISLLIIGLLSLLLLYQAFIALPASMDSLDQKVEFFGCTSSHIYAMEKTIRENLVLGGSEYGTASPPLCLSAGETFTAGSFDDAAVNFELFPEFAAPQGSEELVSVTGEGVAAVKDVALVVYMDCVSGTPDSCTGYVYPLRSL